MSGQLFLSREGRDGGMGVTEVDFEQVFVYRNMKLPFVFDFTSELKALALDDAKGIWQSLRLSKRRNAIPE